MEKKMPASQTIEQFYREAVEMLACPAQSTLPETSLYPPHETPHLLVFFGPAARLPEIRRQLPDSSFLLGLHDAADATTEFRSGRTLVAPVGDGLAYAEKTALLTAILPEKKVRLIVDPGCREKFSSESDSIQHAIRTAIDNATSEERRGLIRLRASCCNTRQMLAGPFVSPAMVSPDTPAVLCGAGPSLAGSLDMLKSIADRVVIVAVGHAVRTLDSAGIMPDIIVEGDALAGRNWPPELHPEALLVATAEVAPEVAARFRHVVWCAGSSLPFNRLAAHYNVPLFHVALNKTVSVHALDYMVRTGFRKIALIGQDYCFGSDGRLYAEKSQSSCADELLELPAASHAGTVSANHTLKMLWEAMNQYLTGIHATPGLQLINLSGGSALQHTEVSTLDCWAKGLPPLLSSQPLFHAAENMPNPFAEETVLELEREQSVLNELLSCCRKLSRELDRYPPRITAIKRSQKDLEQAIQAEAQFRSNAVCMPWLNTVLQAADQIMKETPGMMSDESDPQKQLRFLSRRYSMAGRFFEDLQHSLSQGGDPHCFTAFFEENKLAVQKGNPALAERLTALAPNFLPDFDIHWINQVVPYVKRQINSEWRELSAFISIFTEARSVVDQFVAETGFDPSHDALTVIAPGNWVYVLEWIRRYPALELAVIEPWPELLAQLMGRGCFLHRLPETARVVHTWADPLYVQCRNGWKHKGLRPLQFISPHVADMPDVVSLIRNLELLP
jgi:hypothetical protein